MGKKKNKKYRPSEVVTAPHGSTSQEAQHHETARLCREHPGEWFALYATTKASAYSTASHWRHGRRIPRAYGDGRAWEFGHTITKDPRMRELCVRYVGEGRQFR